MSILMICVNYKNDGETTRFVQDFLNQTDVFDQKIIIVNNSESPSVYSPLTSLASSDPRIWLLTPGKNLGYFGAASLGFIEYSKTFPLPDWVIVSNTDIEFLHANFFSALNQFHANSTHAIVAPAIISSLTGQDQNPNMRARPSRFRMHFYKWVFRYHVPLKIYELLSCLKQSVKKACSRSMGSQTSSPQLTAIYAPHGAFVIFHRTYFDAGGSLDHGTLLYGEEIFVAENARRLGLSVIYDPRLRILHREHSTTAACATRERFTAQAAAYCADTFFTSKGTRGG